MEKKCQRKTCWENNFCQKKNYKKTFYWEKILLEKYLSEKNLDILSTMVTSDLAENHSENLRNKITYRTFTAGLVYLTGNPDSDHSIWHPFGRDAMVRLLSF